MQYLRLSIKKIILISVITTIICVFGLGNAYGDFRITVVYDNSPYREGIATDNGFSCLIKLGRNRVLFDTGGDGTILFSNLSKLGIDLKTIDTIVISHLHDDHTGGLFPFLERQSKATVFLPRATSEMQQMFNTIGISHRIVEKPIQIGKYFFLTGAMGAENSEQEQALIVNTPFGLIIIAGCSHPGITNVISRSKELLNRPVYLVIGGFHAMPATTAGIIEVVQKFKSLGVKKVGPAHCTDEKAKAVFKAVYGKNYITMGAGKTLNLSTN